VRSATIAAVMFLAAGVASAAVYDVRAYGAKGDGVQLMTPETGKSAFLRVHEARISGVPFNRVWNGKQRSLDQTAPAQFVRFDLPAPRTLVVILPDDDPVKILPLSRAADLRRGEECVLVDVKKPGSFLLTFGSKRPPLHVFADAPFVPPADGNVRRFGPGEHDVGVLVPKSGETIVLEAGAVVYGRIFAKGVRDVRVCGRGILDASRIERAEISDTAVCFHSSTNVALEGITVRDAPCWAVIFRNGCRGVTVDGVRLVGMWRYNSDGIDICNSEDVVVRNSFVRSFDDCLVVRGPYLDGETGDCRNVTVSNCVFACDWGKNMEVWAGSRPCVIENVLFKDNACIGPELLAADVTTWYGSASTTIRNVAFEDIEVDVVRPVPAPSLQRSDDEKYVFAERDSIGLFRVDCPRYGRDLGNQQIEPTDDLNGFHLLYENLAFRRWRVLGDPIELTAFVEARKPAHEIRNLVLEDLPADLKVTRR